MSFSADWLALRRDADLRARNADLTDWVREQFAEHRTLCVLDLGAGTGANMAAMAPHLPGGQHWRLADRDTGLLERVTAPPGVTAERVAADLAANPAPLFAPRPDLVTASAFFDLCGPLVIDRIVAATVAARAVFYTVLTYDGREVWAPPHPLDGAVLDAFHADQRRDKGLGPALGPDATAYLESAFHAAGYRVMTGTSDWQLQAARDSALIRMLADGSATAVAPALGAEAGRWGEARAGAQAVTIGHLDLLAWPA